MGNKPKTTKHFSVLLMKQNIKSNLVLAIVVTLILEYMDNHPELTDGDQSHVMVNTMSLDALEAHISKLIEEKLRGIELPPRGESIPHEQAEEVSQDIMDMLDDLNLFNM